MAKKEEIWWTAPATGDGGGTVMVSGRDGVDALIQSGRYPDCIHIDWKYTPGPGGMPDLPTSVLMEEADDALRSTLAHDKGAVLVAVYTGEGERNWVLYAKSTRVFQTLLNDAWASLPLLPVTIRADRDPGWEEYREMRQQTYIPDAD